MRIVKKDSLLLVVDVQEKLFPHMQDKEILARKTATLLQGMEVLGVPSMAARQYPRGLGDVIEELRPYLSDYYDKMTFSCCGDEASLDQLHQAGKKFIIVAGIEAHICVLQTVVDLKNLGFIPVVVTDAIGSRYRPDYETALKRMAYEGAILTTVESILFELCQQAGTEVFKAISRLVK